MIIPAVVNRSMCFGGWQNDALWVALGSSAEDHSLGVVDS